jgi:hypothetical protein
LRADRAPVTNTTDQISFATNKRKKKNTGKIKNLCTWSRITKRRTLCQYQFNQIPLNTVKQKNANAGNSSRKKKVEDENGKSKMLNYKTVTDETSSELQQNVQTDLFIRAKAK